MMDFLRSVGAQASKLGVSEIQAKRLILNRPHSVYAEFIKRFMLDVNLFEDIFDKFIVKDFKDDLN